MPPNPARMSRRELLAYILRLQEKYDHRARKALGQNFLVDPRGYRAFLKPLEGPGKIADVLEVGSGFGLLTCALADVSRRVVGVEIDPILALASRETCESEDRVLIVQGDGLLLLEAWKGVLVSNTPYHLSSRLVSAAAKNNEVGLAVLGVQLELARRMAAKPGERDYGRLTVLAQLFFEVSLVAVLPREWFYPEPEVHGAIVTLRRRRPWSTGLEGLEQFTACLFSQRNKRAWKVVRACTGRDLLGRGDPRRVRELSPEEILEVYMVAAGVENS